MACENNKCEKYGMHHDYENGVEIRKCEFCKRDNQPERLNETAPIPEYGSASSLNFDEWQRRCDSLNSENKESR